MFKYKRRQTHRVNIVDLEAQIAKADEGDRHAQLAAAFRLAKDKQFERAHKYYKQAAAAGLAVAQHNLASMYFNGTGCTQDINEACRWYEAAAAQGDADSQFSLGVIYSSGKELDQDDQLALKWFKAAAENGSARGQYDLGLIYEYGRGVPKDLQQALKWYEEAANQGIEKARQRVLKLRNK